MLSLMFFFKQMCTLFCTNSYNIFKKNYWLILMVKILKANVRIKNGR